MTTLADEVYAEVAPLASQDEANGYATRALVRAVASMFAQPEEAVRAREGKAAWTQVWDVKRCPTFLLPFLGQAVGVNVAPGTDAQMRAQIEEEAAWKRGWLAQLIELIRGTLAPRTNFCTTPSFEYAGVGVGAWTPYKPFPAGAPVLSRITTQHFAGAAAMQVTTPGTTVREGASILIYGNFQPGNSYIASAYLKGALGTEKIRLELGLREEDGAPVEGDFTQTGDETLEAAAWKRITGLVWVPKYAYQMARFVIQRAQAVGQTFYVDNVQIEIGSAASAYMDGDSTAVKWEGVAGASRSLGIGDPRVTVIERDTTPWHFLVNTSPGQSPNPALTEAVTKRSKPVGTIVAFAVTDQPLIAEGTKLISEGAATIAAAKLSDIT